MTCADHPAMRGYELENLRQHAQTHEGRAWLEEHRGLIRGTRAQAKASAEALLLAVEQADELLQRFALVLDESGTA